MKHLRKMLSALIILIDFNLLIPYITGVSTHSSFFIPKRILGLIAACRLFWSSHE